jgi:hypothetical protein
MYNTFIPDPESPSERDAFELVVHRFGDVLQPSDNLLPIMQSHAAFESQFDNLYKADSVTWPQAYATLSQTQLARVDSRLQDMPAFERLMERRRATLVRDL